MNAGGPLGLSMPSSVALPSASGSTAESGLPYSFSYSFMATEATFVDTSSCISEIVEVHSDVLVDLLVVLAVMFVTVALISALEELPVVAVLVSEATLAAIGSCGD